MTCVMDVVHNYWIYVCVMQQGGGVHTAPPLDNTSAITFFADEMYAHRMCNLYMLMVWSMCVSILVVSTGPDHFRNMWIADWLSIQNKMFSLCNCGPQVSNASFAASISFMYIGNGCSASVHYLLMVWSPLVAPKPHEPLASDRISMHDWSCTHAQGACTKACIGYHLVSSCINLLIFCRSFFVGSDSSNSSVCRCLCHCLVVSVVWLGASIVCANSK